MYPALPSSVPPLFVVGMADEVAWVACFPKLVSYQQGLMTDINTITKISQKGWAAL